MFIIAEGLHGSAGLGYRDRKGTDLASYHTNPLGQLLTDSKHQDRFGKATLTGRSEGGAGK